MFCPKSVRMIASAHAPVPRLEIERLTCLRGEREVVAGLSCAAQGGEALLLKGPNGAGKTTALMCIAGIVPAAGGAVRWPGRDPEERPGTDMHLIAHTPAVKPALTVAENLAFWAELLGGHPAAVAPALEEAGLAHTADLEAVCLSAGQTRRLGLARLLVAPRPIWLLDEPTAALDAAGDAWVAMLIDDHLDRGGLVVAATHLSLDLRDPGRIRTVALGGAA